MDYFSQIANRGPEELFLPVASPPLMEPVSLLTTARMMRDNPMAILPEPLFRQTRLTGPYLGREVHEVSGPAEMKSILMDNFPAWRKSPLILRMLSPVLGDAILTAHDESWKRQRKLVQPSFMKRRLDPFIPIMVRAAEQACERLKASANTVTILPVMNDLTFAVIERVIFTDIEGFDRGLVREAIEVLLEDIGRVRYSDLIPFPEWVPRLLTLKARRARAVFRQAVQSQIDARRRRSDPGRDLLGLLIATRDEDTGEALSDEDIRDTVMTFIAAGHETTAIALTWALYLIANDPAVQTALRAEAQQVLRQGEDVSPADVGNLKLAKMVVEEAMRLFPPAPILGRRAMADTDICGHPVRKGDVALLAFYALHRHETLWSNPGYFDPMRWMPDQRPQDRYQFMAFGGGPRACVGAQLAMTEAAIVLATLVRELSFSPTDLPPKPVMQVTLRPEDGLPLHVQPVI